MLDRQRGKDDKTSKQLMVWNGIPNPGRIAGQSRLIRICPAMKCGWRKPICDLRKAAVNIRKPLAQRYLTTVRTLFLCMENLTGENCR